MLAQNGSLVPCRGMAAQLRAGPGGGGRSQGFPFRGFSVLRGGAALRFVPALIPPTCPGTAEPRGRAAPAASAHGSTEGDANAFTARRLNPLPRKITQSSRGCQIKSDPNKGCVSAALSWADSACAGARAPRGRVFVPARCGSTCSSAAAAGISSEKKQTKNQSDNKKGQNRSLVAMFFKPHSWWKT